MAFRRQTLAILQDENAEINRGKSSVAKSGGLKAQQADLSDRKTLSNITNKLKLLPSSGFATPSASRKDGGLRAGTENARVGLSIMPDAEFFGQRKSGAFSSAKQSRGMSRDPLRNITNVESMQNKAPGTTVQTKKSGSQAKNLKLYPNPRFEVTEETKHKADLWAREGIERVHFTGKDMEAVRQKIAEEEVNKRVAQALSYRTDLPCFLPCALEKDPPDIKDTLELDPVEDLIKKEDSPRCDMEKWIPVVDYEESFVECLEILQIASKDWPLLVEEQV
eukprot:Gb_07427 [translate_table: standard]